MRKPLLRFLDAEVTVPGFTPTEGWKEIEKGRYVKTWEGRGGKITAEAEGERVTLRSSLPKGLPRMRSPRAQKLWLLEALEDLEECASFPPAILRLTFFSPKQPEEVKAKLEGKKVEAWGRELKLSEVLRLQDGCRVTFTS